MLTVAARVRETGLGADARLFRLFEEHVVCLNKGPPTRSPIWRSAREERLTSCCYWQAMPEASSCRPSGAPWISGGPVPGAHAPGYIPPPLRG
jgi:hypothetical protein